MNTRTLDRAMSEPAADSPLYRQVIATLRAEIEAGVHPVGALLPTEAELRARFSVSRHTVREALRLLRDEGLVSSRQGAGTRVVRADPQGRFVHEVASIADLTPYAEELRYQVNSSAMIAADADLAQRLDCPVGQRWLRVEGFRYPAGQASPSAWTEVFVHADYAGIALYLGRRPGPIYLWIEDMYATSVDEVEQVFSGRPAPAGIGDALGVKPADTVIEARRSYLLKDGSLALIAYTLHPADHFRHATVLRRARG